MESTSTPPARLDDGAELDDFRRSTDAALVEFYTAGCPKCQAMEPVLGNVARATGIDVGFCNPGDDIGLVDEYDIRSVPTIVLFEDGEEVARLDEGFVGAADVVEFLSTHVPRAVETE